MKWNQTVTLFHQTAPGTWSAQVIGGVSAVAVCGAAPRSYGEDPDDRMIVRIPQAAHTEIAPGDRLAWGEAATESTADLTQTEAFCDARFVTAVTENDRGSGRLRHTKVVCK